MSLTFNWNTVLSSFDERGTLLKQLKSMEDAFEAAGMTDCEVVDPTDTSLKLKFTFADGSSLTTGAIDIKGAKGDKGDTGDTGPQGPQGEPGGITNINGYTGAVTTGNGLTFNNGALASYDFNLTDTGSINMNTLTLPSNVSAAAGTINYALNSDGSIGKIYGGVSVTLNTVSANTWTPIDTGITVAIPTTGYSINVGMLARKADGTAGFGVYLQIDNAGKVKIAFNQTSSQSGMYWIEYPACLYFFKDFGDEQNNRSLPLRMAALDPVEEPQER